MFRRVRSGGCVLVAAGVLGFAISARAQESARPEPVKLASGIRRLAGTETKSQIQWARLILDGTLRSPEQSLVQASAGVTPPLLIAQCTLHPNGRYGFEMFTSFGGEVDLAFYPPWTPAGPQDLFAAHTEKATMTMEFLGYTHVKPLHRQWEIPVETPGLYHFNPPGRDSSNLEEIAFDLRYMNALPTTRLTVGNRTSEFVTTELLAEIRREPMCRAAGL